MFRPCFHLVIAVCAALAQPGQARAEEVVVFAAASLKTALDRVVAAWEAESGALAAVSYGATPILAKQIEQGAPADLFLAASPDWMDYLQDRGLILPQSRRDLLGNELVLIAFGAGVAPVDMAKLDLPKLLAGDRLAMALVDSVPAGVYGKAALTSLGQWDAVAPSVAQADNVRAALALVAQGEAPFGIVYATDAQAETAVTIVGTFPDATHPPIRYPVALTTDSSNPAAGELLDYLHSPAALDLFRAEGFRIIE